MNSDEIKFQNKPEDHNKKLSFEIGYIVPFWSSKPVHKYTLDIWREGVIVDTIDISGKEYYLVGRNKNICDIYLNNMTISRIHCVIQHKDDGDVFLYDLDSVYGTFINKRPIAKKTYIKLNIGDTFKLGQSNKMFILNGPPVLNAQQEEALNADSSFVQPANKYIDKKELIERRIKMVKELHDQRENYKNNVLGVEKDYADWGQSDFDEDIKEYQREEEEMYSNERNKLSNEDLEGSLNLEEIKERKDLSQKQKNMIEKLENLNKGIEKIKDEVLKLKKKEMDQGELTEGQKKRIDIDGKKLTDMYEKYETIENNLRISLTSKEEHEGLVEQKFNRKLARELDSDDDEFFDRSKTNTRQQMTNENTLKNPQVITENYETLKQKLENTIRNRQRLLDKLQKVDTEKQKDNFEEIDSLDLFFMETQNQIKSDTKSSLTGQINEMTKEIAITQKLLSLVTPSHIKIKFKADEEIHKQSSLVQQASLPEDKSSIKKKKIEGVVQTMNRFNKLTKKIAIEYRNAEDEENLEEAESMKDILAKEIEMDENFKKKIEDFKRSLINNNNSKTMIEEKAGLIISANPKEERGKVKMSNTLFSEIVSNISNNTFDLGNYNLINTVINKKKEERSTIKNNIEIDFSHGGLQTFNGNSLNNITSPSESFANKKRDREAHVVYGVSAKPADRNIEESDEDHDANDYDVIYTVGEKLGTEHNLNVNPYNKDNSQENDNFKIYD